MKKALPFLLVLFMSVSLPLKAQFDTTPRVVSKFGLSFCLPDFTSSASNELGSVIDYGVTDMPGLASLEVPVYKGVYGVGVSYGIEFPLYYEIFIESGIGFSYMQVKNSFANNRLAITYHGKRYELDYGCNERYNLSYIQVPVLIGYDLSLDEISSIRVSAGVLAGIGVSAKCKLKDGYSDYVIKNVNPVQNSKSEEAYSTFSGSIDLYSGDYSISQVYIEGLQDTYEYKDKVAAPFKRFDLGLMFGISYVFDDFEFGASYDYGLMNIANDEYFSSTDRVGGCLLTGSVVRSEQGMNDYKHKVNILRFFVNYRL